METETIALAPRAPYIGVEGQFEGHEQEWKQSNVRNFPYLTYKATTIAGQAAPPPQRQGYEPPIQAMVLAIQPADGDIKATTGLFDPSLGNLSRSERSGRAIQALQRQGEHANANYLDNLSRAIVYTGRILVDLIPAIYDRPGRIARILGTDEEAKTVALNAPYVPGPQGQPTVLPPGMPAPAGAPVQVHDLARGRYTVQVTVGPSFASRRQEGVGAMLELLQTFPALAPLVSDLVVADMDWPGARQVAERLKKLLPPQLQPEQNAAMMIPQLQQQLQQAGQLIDVLTKSLNETNEQLRADVVKAKAQA